MNNEENESYALIQYLQRSLNMIVLESADGVINNTSYALSMFLDALVRILGYKRQCKLLVKMMFGFG